MEPVMAGSFGALLALGMFLIAAGLRRTDRPFSTTQSTGVWIRALKLWNSWSTPRQTWVAASLVGGIVVATATGWLIAVVLVPAASLGIPALLSVPRNARSRRWPVWIGGFGCWRRRSRRASRFETPFSPRGHRCPPC